MSAAVCSRSANLCGTTRTCTHGAVRVNMCPNLCVNDGIAAQLGCVVARCYMRTSVFSRRRVTGTGRACFPLVTLRVAVCVWFVRVRLYSQAPPMSSGRPGDIRRTLCAAWVARPFMNAGLGSPAP